MKLFFFAAMLILAKGSALSQPLTTISITGTVISDDQHPLAGSTLISSVNHFQTTTTSDGNFRLAIHAGNDTVYVSHLGYETKKIVIRSYSDTSLTIYLNVVARELQEVVVNTGYQTLSKERATGSFVQIDNELLNRSVSPDIIERLQGLASGLSFNKTNTGGDEIRIRGVSTILSNANPLIVIDNFPYDGSLSNINPNDVASVTILKDAAAASIWGARAGNGVIVITSKSGRYNQAPSIQYSSNFTYVEKPYLFKYPNMSTSQLIDAEIMLFEKGAYNSNIKNKSTYPALSPVTEILLKKRRLQITDQEAADQINALRGIDVRNDYLDYAYHSGLLQQHSLSVNGGNKNINYFLSAGYDNNTGSLKEKSKRVTLRSENNLQLSPKLEMSAGIIYTITINKDHLFPAYNTEGQYPYERLIDDLGKPAYIMRTNRDSFLIAAEDRGFLNWRFSPLTDAAGNNKTSHQFDTRLNLGIKYKLLPGLLIQTQYQFENQNNEDIQLEDTTRYFTRDLINKYTQLDGSKNISERPLPLGGILDVSNDKLISHTGRLQLKYNLEKNRSSLYALAGAEIKQLRISSDGRRLYGYDDNTLAFQTVNTDSTYRLYPRSSARIPDGISINDLLNRYRSFFGNAGYIYDSRYVITGSARIDASNYFGVKTNQRAVPLWSAGIKWNISKENFYLVRFLPILQFRATYGYSGNVNKGLTAYSTALNLSGSQLTKSPYAQIISPPNSALRWEKVRMINLGLDFRLLKSILWGSIEYYNKKGIDLVGDYAIDPTIGFLQSGTNPQYRANIASMRGQGVDIDLNSSNINKIFKWNTTFLLSYSKDKVTDYYVPVTATTDYIGAKNSITPIVGKPLYAVYSYRWAGLDPANGDPLGYLNGEISKNYTSLVSTPIQELRFHGSARPVIFGALRNTFQYKAFSISANITYKLKYYFSRKSISYTSLFKGKMGHRDFEMRWQKPGDELVTNVPSLLYPESTSNRTLFYNSSEILVEKGDHIRLQDINLSYNLSIEPKKTIKKVNISLYISNLGLLWKACEQDIDPDYYNAIPPSKRFALSLKAYL